MSESTSERQQGEVKERSANALIVVGAFFLMIGCIILILLGLGYVTYFLENYGLVAFEYVVYAIFRVVQLIVAHPLLMAVCSIVVGVLLLYIGIGLLEEPSTEGNND